MLVRMYYEADQHGDNNLENGSLGRQYSTPAYVCGKLGMPACVFRPEDVSMNPFKSDNEEVFACR